MSPIGLCAATLTALLVGYTDHKTGRMPNVITLGSLVLALSAQVVLGGTDGLLRALLGALFCGIGPAGLFLLSKGEAIGGGDVKALFALGAWLGPDLGLESELLAFTLLFIVALGRALVSGQALRLMRGSLLALRAGSMQMGNPGPGPNESGSPERTFVRFGPYLALTVTLCCSSEALGSWGGPLFRWITG